MDDTEQEVCGKPNSLAHYTPGMEGAVAEVRSIQESPRQDFASKSYGSEVKKALLAAP
jgi:hypothetical protein